MITNEDLAEAKKFLRQALGQAQFLYDNGQYSSAYNRSLSKSLPNAIVAALFHLGVPHEEAAEWIKETGADHQRQFDGLREQQRKSERGEI